MPKPLKRHIALQPVSREHHYILLLAFKIREGQKRGIDIQRIESYVDWFWKDYFLSHLAFEEAHVFGLLSDENEWKKKGIQANKKLKRLFDQTPKTNEILSEIEKAVVAHVRFEERQLFEYIQQVIDEEDLKKLTALHQKRKLKSWEDAFWNKTNKRE